MLDPDYHKKMNVLTESTSHLISVLVGLQSAIGYEILANKKPDPEKVEAVKKVCAEIDRRVPVPDNRSMLEKQDLGDL